MMNAEAVSESLTASRHPVVEKHDKDDLNSSSSRREEREVRVRRLLFRSWRRGTQESDVIFGSFAEQSLDEMDSAQLDRFEGLLDCVDPDLFEWIIRGWAPPPEHDHDVLRLLRAWLDRWP